MNNTSINKIKFYNTLPQDLPLQFFKELLSWKLLIKSPYGCSYYNAPADWDYKAPNSLRISDHWNFYSRGSQHCITSTNVQNNTHWTLAKFNANTQMYEMIKSLPKSKSKLITVKSFNLDRLTGLYQEKYQIFLKHNVGISKNIFEERKSRFELAFLNKYFKLLEQ